MINSLNYGRILEFSRVEFARLFPSPLACAGCRTHETDCKGIVSISDISRSVRGHPKMYTPQVPQP